MSNAAFEKKPSAYWGENPFLTNFSGCTFFPAIKAEGGRRVQKQIGNMGNILPLLTGFIGG